MAKKVLIISSSPRKGGNSDTLCDKFAQGAAESNNQVEKIFLKDKNINYCIGCGLCVENNNTGCSQNDDMTEILEKIINTDVIVLATPVYFYSMSAQMKTLIDRCCAKYTQIKNKDFYFILTSADTEKASLERTVEALRGFLDCLENAKEKQIIYGTGVWKKNDVEKTDFPQQAYILGKSV